MTTPTCATRASASSACSRSRSATARLRPRLTVVRGDGRERGRGHGTIVGRQVACRHGPIRRHSNRTIRCPTPPCRCGSTAAAAVPLGVQLSGQVRELVLAGTLGRGDRLPSTRALAADLGVARSVTEQAYDQLLAEGWLEARRGRRHLRRLRRRPGARRAGPASHRLTAAPDLVRLDAGTPWIDPRHAAGWRRAWREVSTARPPRGYDDPRGLPELRAALADHAGPDPRPGRRPRRGGASPTAPPTGCGTCSRCCRPARWRSRTRATGPRSRRSAAPAARSCDLPATAPVDRPGRRRRRLRHPGPPAPARPRDAGRGPARRCSTAARAAGRGAGGGRLRLGVPLRRRARARPGHPRPVPGRLPRHRLEVGRAEPAAGLAGAAARPAGHDQPPPRASPTTPPPGRCSGRSWRCCATATSTRWCAPRAGCTPSGRRGWPPRCRRTPSWPGRSPGCTPPGCCRTPTPGAPATRRADAGFGVNLLSDYCRSRRR